MNQEWKARHDRRIRTVQQFVLYFLWGVASVLALLILSTTLSAAEKPGKWRKVWRASQAALLASHGADALSSQGRPELNPLLRGPQGNFGRRGALIKFGITGGLFAVQELVNRNGEHSKALTIINFAATGVTAGVAARNFRLPKIAPRETPPPTIITPFAPRIGGPQ